MRTKSPFFPTANFIMFEFFFSRLFPFFGASSSHIFLGDDVDLFGLFFDIGWNSISSVVSWVVTFLVGSFGAVSFDVLSWLPVLDWCVTYLGAPEELSFSSSPP